MRSEAGSSEVALGALVPQVSTKLEILIDVFLVLGMKGCCGGDGRRGCFGLFLCWGGIVGGVLIGGACCEDSLDLDSAFSVVFFIRSISMSCTWIKN